MKRRIVLILTVFAVILCLFGSVSAQDEGVKILNQANKSTVRIIGALGSGTGFFINEKQIVTNHHVVSPFLKDGFVGGQGWWSYATNAVVEVAYSVLGNDIVNGVVVQDWPEVDLALVEVDPSLVKRVPMKLQTEDNVFRGMNIYTIGFPGINYDNVLESNEASLTDGSIANITPSSIQQKDITKETPLFQKLVLSSAINPGNSGGPIVDRKCNVVGIANSNYINGNEIAFYGIHIHELTTRLNNAGIKYELANNQPNLILWIVIGVLAAAVITAAILLLRKSKKNGNADNSVVPGGKDPAPNATIQGLTGQFSGIKKSLNRDKDCVIGKDPTVCTMVFEKNVKGVSGKHCRIHFSNTHKRFIIQDLSSTNGTVLVRGSNQRQVPTNSGLALQNGDLIYVPNKDNTFRVNL